MSNWMKTVDWLLGRPVEPTPDPEIVLTAIAAREALFTYLDNVLKPLGFERRKAPDSWFRDRIPEFLDVICASTSVSDPSGSLKAHVLVGMHGEKFQRAFKKLQGERYQIIEPSFTTDLGYLMPDAQFKSWRFRRDVPNLEEAKAREMADGILKYGLPWLCRIDSLDAVRRAIESESGWRDVDMPLFELLYGDYQTANLLAQDNLRRLEAVGKPNSSLEILKRWVAEPELISEIAPQNGVGLI